MVTPIFFILEMKGVPLELRPVVTIGFDKRAQNFTVLTFLGCLDLSYNNLFSILMMQKLCCVYLPLSRGKYILKSELVFLYLALSVVSWEDFCLAFLFGLKPQL